MLKDSIIQLPAVSNYFSRSAVKMSSIFCCANVQPYKNRTLSHESKFRIFMAWANYPKQSTITAGEAAPEASTTTLAIQIVKQVNYGPLESKRYFVQCGGINDEYFEVTEQWLVDANFEKLNRYIRIHA
jgi:hypothetical protein